MTDTFVIRNQLGHYWGKGKHWVDGSEPKTVMKLAHHDQAINTLVELSSKDIELRGEIVETELNARGEPKVEASDITLPETPATEDAPSPVKEEPSAETPELQTDTPGSA